MGTFHRTVWAESAGFNPISSDMLSSGAEEKPMLKNEWRFTQVDGIYVPSYFKLVQYWDGQLDHGYELEFQESKLNEPVDPSQFTYAAMGLKDGAVVLDRIDGICYIMKGGEITKLANFDEKYVPKAGAGPRDRVRRWLGGAIGIAALAVVIGVSWWRRRRRGQGVATLGGEAKLP
jgi:hypothetical protein